MSITVNLYYTGRDGSARKFAEEMVSSGTVDAIRAEPGNLKYDYFIPPSMTRRPCCSSTAGPTRAPSTCTTLRP